MLHLCGILKKWSNTVLLDQQLLVCSAGQELALTLCHTRSAPCAAADQTLRAMTRFSLVKSVQRENLQALEGVLLTTAPSQSQLRGGECYWHSLDG